MSNTSNGSKVETVAAQYLSKIDQALSELTVDELRQVVLEIEENDTERAEMVSYRSAVSADGNLYRLQSVLVNSVKPRCSAKY